MTDRIFSYYIDNLFLVVSLFDILYVLYSLMAKE